jgi:hypothetical protein
VGFLLTAVPKCFSAHALAELRGKQSRERAEVRIGTRREIGGEPEDPALVRWRKDQEAALLDPSVSEQEKHLIRLCLGLNTPPH